MEPRTLQGFDDRHGAEMIVRNHVKNVWEDIFQNFGYSAIETPSLEYSEILTGKYGEEEKLIYHFEDHGGRRVALRYDQTVPFARYLTQHRNLIVLPFKRYEISRVWRADAARKGRRREFYQCDIDIAGTDSMMADSEILQVLYAGFMKLGFAEHKILLNHRKLVSGFIQSLNISQEQAIEVYRAIDKFDKVGQEGVKKELLDRGIQSQFIPKILEFISLDGDNNQVMLSTLADLVKGNELGELGLSELKEIIEICAFAGIPSQNIQISPRLVRGLDYYTGAIFEVVVDGFPGSLAGGGRYDGLCGRFSNEEIHAVGVAVGFEPLCMLMTEKKMGPKNTAPADLFLVLFNNEMKKDVLHLAQNFRTKGLRVQVSYEASKLGKQFEKANKLGIPQVVILGPDEKARGVYVVKNMETGEQKEEKIPV
ncbi:histidine--tRNA ligase [Candidatus Peregrinibacteria bacterium RIFOXYA12_FULL_33_12]|nr:MAG: histidine--tRNA ligase [Candidatus Peregrinibacteria bacterium RIFOXYA2_FULL_33_21]OGJ46782.1 MAG: histidine--tRNA ligase [Candidatus Peregrinibacteria bacterium RIFOXYA12_FULL_33_12]OGJ51244.1 MAG: histidine--tRNA ligase [Candidatus Peregrinibacteria bacterium RIFOXYB2_FULL_33_20]